MFYQVRHETYTRAWEQYKKQLEGDIAQQVFMSVTASVISAAVQWIPCIGSAIGSLAYFTVYTLLTKFYIDLSIHEAESRMRAETYYPALNDKRGPVSLNEKSMGDSILGDSMAAALIGHPGGYYTEVSGGEPGNMYTAQVLVSPPNLARMLNSFGGFLELLWQNLWSMGESNPDAFIALDFDDLNLDYLLLTSELPAFNQHSYYTYENTDGLDTLYAWYWANTLGYLESKVNTASGGLFDAIRPTCIDGRPQYEFINRTTYDTVLPQNVLYRPIVLSQERYDRLSPAPGHLVVQVQCKDYTNTEGINAYEMNDMEHKAGYIVKVPIKDNGFEYPIQYISVDVVKDHTKNGLSYIAQDLLVDEANYIIDSGNLYFTRSLEEIIAEKCQGFDSTLSQLVDTEVYYKVHIVFDLFVPDTTEETNSLALAQATFYTIMDYFNQYTYAEVSANMISEIAYTETVTFWSTLISAPLVFLGSWTVMGTGAMISQAGASSVKSLLFSTLKSFVIAPIREVFEEIIKDGFIEAVIENVVGMVGLPDDVGFWLSSMATSWRETKGALAELSALGQAAGRFKNLLSIVKSGDSNALIELRKQLTQNLDQQQDTDSDSQQQKKSWQKLLASGFFRGISMVMSTFYFGSFNFLTLRSLKNLIMDFKTLSPKSYGEYKARQHAKRKADLEALFANQPSMNPQNILIDNMKESAKKPAGINEGSLHTLFRNMQESNQDNPPTVDISILFNSNPKIGQRNELAKKFNEIRVNHFFENTELFKKLQPDGADIQRDEIQLVEKRLRTTGLEVEISLGDNYEGLFPEHDREIIDYIHSKLFDPEYDLKKPKKVLDRIIYRSDLILEARDILKSTKYNDLDIIIDEMINWEVLAILQDKFNSGEEWSKLERIIADVASFYMGGRPPVTLDNLERSKFQKMKKVVLKQLEVLQNSGDRLYHFNEIKELTGLSNQKARELIPQFLQTLDFVSSPERARTLWSLLFGLMSSTNYQKIKEKCAVLGYELKLDWYEFFELMANRGDKRSDRVSVPVECENGHISQRIISNLEVKPQCKSCYHESTRTDPDQVLDVARARGVRIDMTKKEIELSLERARKEGYVRGAKFICEHECGHRYVRSYESLLEGSGCRHCGTRKNENFVRLLAELTFKDYVDKFQSGVSMLQIFPHLKGEIHPNMHIDMFAIFEINDRAIKLGIEYNGEQHYSFKSFVYFRTGKDMKNLDLSTLEKLYQDFLDSKNRDKFKVEEFKKFNDKDYYLIVVPYTVKKEDRQQFIIDKFEKQTGIKLPDIKLLDWRNLWS